MRRTIHIIGLVVLFLTACKSGKNLANYNHDSVLKNEIESGESPIISQKEQVNKKIFFKALNEKEQGNIDNALELFDKMLSIQPDLGSVFYERGLLYEQKEEMSFAEESFKKAVELTPDNVWYKEKLVSSYNFSRNYQAALPIWEEVVKSKKKNEDYLDYYAFLLTQAGRFDEAIAVLDELQEKVGNHPKIVLDKYRMLIHMRKDDQAVQELEKYYYSIPKTAKIYSIPEFQELEDLLFSHYTRNGQDEKIFDLLKSLEKAKPEDPMMLFGMATYYGRKEEDEKSFDYLKRAFEKEKLPFRNKAIVLEDYMKDSEMDYQKKEEAKILLSILEKVNPKNPKTYEYQYRYSIRDNDFENSRKYIKKLLELDQTQKKYWIQLVQLNAELDFLEEQEIDAKLARETFPYEPNFYLFEGMAKIDLGKAEEGVTVLKEGLTYVLDKQTEHDFRRYLGEGYHRLGDDENSDKNFERSIVLIPDDAGTLNNYSYYLALRGTRLSDAEIMSSRSNKLRPGTVSYLDTYGYILFRLNRFEEAKNWIENALNNGGENNYEILEHYGDVEYKLNNVDSAVEYWKKSLEKNNTREVLKKKIKEKKYYGEGE